MPTTGADAGDGGADDEADGADGADARLVEVVAGVVFDAERRRVLLALRRPEQHQGDRWEFPGGKVEPGEALEAALARELGEEVGLAPVAWRHRRTLEHVYPDKRVRLHFVDVTAFDGTPEGREGQTLRWTALAELGALRFPDANLPIVEQLLAEAARGRSGREDGLRRRHEAVGVPPASAT